MPTFITIGYGDQEGYDRTPEDIRAAAHAYDAKQQASGVVMGMASSPTQVQNTLGQGVMTTHGPYMSSVLPVAGFSIIEAADLDEAIDIASHAPCAVAYGVVEVWPLVLPAVVRE